MLNDFQAAIEKDHTVVDNSTNEWSNTCMKTNFWKA